MSWTQADIDARNVEVLGVRRKIDFEFDIATVPAGEIQQDLRPEWMIEAECTKLLEEDGWRALRTDPVSDRSKGKGFGEPGMADHLYIRYSFPSHPEPIWRAVAEVLWIEFKSAKGKPKRHQLDWHQKERARGALTLIAGVDFPASVAGFTDWYAKSGLQRAINAASEESRGEMLGRIRG